MRGDWDIEILPDADAVVRRGADLIGAAARLALAARHRCVLALSGGRTPREMIRLLAAEPLDWRRVHVVQVDERVAPEGSPDRNATTLTEAFLARGGLPTPTVHAMPVDDADLEAAAERYGRTLVHLAGSPPVLDLVHLGIGADGHTASLVPGDAALDVAGADVTVAGPYQGRRRMTLTYPVIDRARRILWVVTGDDKADAVAGLVRGDRSLPAGRVAHERATLLLDRAAAARMEEGSISRLGRQRGA